MLKKLLQKTNFLQGLIVNCFPCLSTAHHQTPAVCIKPLLHLVLSTLLYITLLMQAGGFSVDFRSREGPYLKRLEVEPGTFAGAQPQNHCGRMLQGIHPGHPHIPDLLGKKEMNSHGRCSTSLEIKARSYLQKAPQIWNSLIPKEPSRNRSEVSMSLLCATSLFFVLQLSPTRWPKATPFKAP